MNKSRKRIDRRRNLEEKKERLDFECLGYYFLNPKVVSTEFFFFFFLGRHLWHMEIPRLGVKSEL